MADGSASRNSAEAENLEAWRKEIVEKYDRWIARWEGKLLLSKAIDELRALQGAPVSERREPSKGDVAVAIDCLRWMALCTRVTPQDVAVACMGSTTTKDWIARLNRITDPYLPALPAERPG